MSRFFHNRNLSAEIAEESGKKELRNREVMGSTKYLVGSPLSCYNEVLPPCLATGTRFFSNNKALNSPKLRKNHRSAQASRLVHTSQDNHRPSTAPACWEISERIESCEIRCQQSTEVQDKLKLWKNCCSDVIPVFTKENNELGRNLNRLTKGIFEVFGNANDDWNAKINSKVVEIQFLCEEIKILSQTVTSLQNEVRGFKEVKLAEDLKIQSEIEMIFGNDDKEIKEIQKRSQTLLDLKPSGIVAQLKEIYKNLTKEKYIPEYKDFTIDSPNPDDISMAFKYNYHLILKSTTRKVLSLLKKEFHQSDIQTQTSIPCISLSEHEELLKKFEKSTLALQSALVQNEKLREDNIGKSQIADRFEKEKNQAHYDMLRFKRENDASSKELFALKKDFETIFAEHEAAKKTIESKVKETMKQELRLQSQAMKIKKLTMIAVTDLDEESRISEAGSPFNREFERNFTDFAYDQPKRSPRNRDYTEAGIGRRSVRTANSASTTLAPRGSLYQGYGNNKSNFSSNSSIDAGENEKNEKNDKNIGKEIFPGGKFFPNRQTDEKINTMPTIPEDGSFMNERSTEKSKKKKKKSDKNARKTPESPGKGSISRQSTFSKEKNSKKNAKISKESSANVTSQDQHTEIEENQREIIRDGKVIHITNKSTNTNSLRAVVSVGVQFNWESPDQDFEEKTSETSGLYMFHFNPNNVYGLKGDIFYNSTAKVFSAQSRTKELSSHFFSELK